MSNIGFEKLFAVPLDESSNPLPWMKNWTNSKNSQPAPQETEITTYIVNSIDKTSNDDVDLLLNNFKL
jgi:ribonucleoside-diphosphate reductase beta chain